MPLNFTSAHPRTSPSLLSLSRFHLQHTHRLRLGFSVKKYPEPISRLWIVNRSSGDKWNLRDMSTDAFQEKFNSWIAQTRSFFSEIAAPIVKGKQGNIPDVGNVQDSPGIDEIFIVEQTVDIKSPNGNLSLAAVTSIEQFSRMNGLTGWKMQKIFQALAPDSISNDVRSLVEYCCFRYLSRDNSDIHPSLKELAFQKLLFVTMIAWEHPYTDEVDLRVTTSNKFSLETKLVGKDAFVRFAPAVAGLADHSTAHHLFKALVGDESGISLRLWISYISELYKIHQGRKSFQIQENLPISEQILCIGSSRKRPVLKWEGNMAWPGKLTLTDKALYFEAIGLRGIEPAIRLDLSASSSCVKKAKVGPLGTTLFDSAISISSGLESKTWVLEFVDFGGEMRRDVWFAFISEIISLHNFIREFGPSEEDPSIRVVYGANRGKKRAVTSATNSITRLQCLQLIRKLSEDPSKLVHFSYLQNAPYGDIVYQALAVHFWGGPIITKINKSNDFLPLNGRSSETLSSSYGHVFDINGNVYLNKWMKSQSWLSSASITFWKNYPIRQGIVLSTNLVVSDTNLVERAAITCREKSQVVERTQATIDAAMIKGIPSNIDLFKEIVLPITIMAKNMDRLRYWEQPRLTFSFLVFAYTIIFRDLLSYVFPSMLMFLSVTMLLLKGLKEQGRLGRSFGKVTIHDQPPSNTIQKIVALKEAMTEVESYLQKLNVSLLKVRTVILSGHPQITTEVALAFLLAATSLLIIPFKYVLSFLLLDLFTRELPFRKEVTKKFMKLLKDRWDMIPAAPVIVLPYESTEDTSEDSKNGPDQRKYDENRKIGVKKFK